ncbi:hypothetical protein BJX61DRAFT_546973 [Aspergillus egyptiacus]|nr:hypothetical protein BJX61DRAFT_546973 [Aspergillus egyptiacus]
MSVFSDAPDRNITAASAIPPAVARKLLDFVPKESRRSLRLTCRAWAQAIDEFTPLSLPTANTLPPEILIQIFYLLSPRDFDNARRTCSQWMRASLHERLLESMLKRAGWWDSWLWDKRNRHDSSEDPNHESTAWKMSKRFSTECILSGRKMNVERSGFLTTSVVDFSQLSQGGDLPDSGPTPRFSSDPKDRNVPTASSFHVSNCGNYLLVVSGCKIHVYQLSTRRPGISMPTSVNDLEHTDLYRVASITCPVVVLSATIDTSTPNCTVAALLCNRLGMICDLTSVNLRGDDDFASIVHDPESSTAGRCGRRSVHLEEIASRHLFYDVCTAQAPPHSLSICPGQRCVAFGSDTGIELRWVDERTKKDCRKQFPMSQPSEILHFMPNQPGMDLEFRLISSLAGPGADGCVCQNLPPADSGLPCPFHAMRNNVQTFSQWAPEQTDQMGLVRTTQCHHYRAIPVNDGVHVMFVEPRSGFLCIGSDAPIDGPTSLTRALICVPPSRNETSDKEPLPTAFAAGSNLNWGLRVVAAYGDRLVFYSVPLDVFNVIKKERERQGDGVMADSDLARDFFVNNSRGSGRHGSLAQNQNGDWEFLLSISYRPTAMMWPFKIYGKEIGRVDSVVELALQSSHGGARIWAFSASGTTSVIDVDTFTKSSQEVSDIPCKSFTIGPDGQIQSARLVDRADHLLVNPPETHHKRQQPLSRAEFAGRHMLRQKGTSGMLHGQEASSTVKLLLDSGRRPSFAARIVDFRIPDLESEAVY